MQPHASNGTSNAGHGFFSQLNWQEHKENAESAGYVPFEDRIPEDFESVSGSSSGSSSSSDGESSDEFNMFHAPVNPDSKKSSGGGGGGGLVDEGGLLIGNLGSDTGNNAQSSNTPQIKLIEFGSEPSEPQQAPPTSTPASYVDPFQQQQPSSVPSSSKPISDPFGVVFDPFSGLSSTEANPPSNADSAFGDLLGFGLGDSVQTATPQSETTASTGAESKGSSRMPTQSSGEKDLFDPFGSLGGNQKAPTLMPTSTVSAATPSNFYHGHRYSEPFTNPSAVMPPSVQLAPQATQNQGRKLSSPGPLVGHKPPITTNKLAASFSATVSHSHPNLASFGAAPPSSSTYEHSGWDSGMGMGGSVSHNTSPRRSPSPIPQSSSTGNISQPPPDPFQQFNLKDVSGGMNGVKPSSTTPTSQHSKPPIGNSYQPHYMQNQARNGTQQHSSQPNSSRLASTGMGPKPKPASTFQTRPQSPNYNPSLFSTIGNKTGNYACMYIKWNPLPLSRSMYPIHALLTVELSAALIICSNYTDTMLFTR